MEYKRLSKKALGCMYVATIIGTIIGASVITAGYWFFLNEIWKDSTTWLNALFFVVMAMIVLEMIMSPLIRYRRYRYCINAEKIDMIEGLFFIKRDIVPIERIHKITLKKGPIDRMFGVAKVIITTAGGDVVIRFLQDETADEIAESLKTKINQIIREQGVR